MTYRLCHGDSVELLYAEPAASVHLALFNPPYDTDHDYTRAAFRYRELGSALRRVLVTGGVAVLVIGDKALDGVQTGISFRTAVDWTDRVRLRLFQSNVYVRSDVSEHVWANRFRHIHENILVFVNGTRPRTFDKAGYVDACGHWPTSVQPYPMDANPRKGARLGTFPDVLAETYIRVFSRPGDTVADPYMGTGTTGVQALRLRRVFLGIDIDAACVALASRRIDAEVPVR